MEYLEFKVLPLVQMREDGAPFDLTPIRKLCSAGLDRCPPEDRTIAWLVLSGVYINQPEEWEERKTQILQQYKEFTQLFKIESYENEIIENSTGVTDFGLENNHLMEIIHGDVIRTGHHIIKFPNKDTEIKSDDADDTLLPYHEHMRRVERILYVFANLNPTVSYMQGFNEIVCVLYYIFASSSIYFNNNYLDIEATSFFTFQQMYANTRLGELFTTQDQSSLIHNRMNFFMKLLERHLPKAHNIITQLSIHPLHFCYRKLNLLFAQDHEIPDLIYIWDALFAHFSEFIEYEAYIMVANVKMIEELMDIKDYVQTMVALQKLKICDAKKLVLIADQLWQTDHPSP